MINSDITARREKLMLLGFANLIATGFMHAAPSDFMRALPPFANTEGKPGFTLPEDLRVAYEYLKSKDKKEEMEDNHHIFSLSGYIAHDIFGGQAETKKVLAILSSLFNELSDNKVMLPNVDGVENIKQWMKQVETELSLLNNKNKKIKKKILNICQSTGLFLENKET